MELPALFGMIGDEALRVILLAPVDSLGGTHVDDLLPDSLVEVDMAKNGQLHSVGDHVQG